MSVARLTLVCQGATAATRIPAYPAVDDALDTSAAAKGLPGLSARLGWQAHARASPSRAACDTAAALARTVATDPALRECDYGRWAGRSMAEVADAEPEAFARWLGDSAAAPPDGESLDGLLKRARAWLGTQTATPATALAVVPPGLLRALVVVALDLPPATFWRLDAAPLGVSRLTAQGGRWRLAGFNAAA